MNQPAIKYDIQVACYSFKCPACGTKIQPGDNYLQMDGANTCLSHLPEKPARRLKPLLTLTEK